MAARKKTVKPPVNLKAQQPGLKKMAVLWKPKKPAKGKKPVTKKQLMEKMFEQYFFGLSHTKFVQLTKDWNDENLKLELEQHKDYDSWLNYFKTLSVNQLMLLSQTGLDILPAEAYAALSFWRDIMSNPSRIKNIHRAGLTGAGDTTESISQLAEKNDRYGVLKAIRNQLAAKLQNNPGNRDAADLAKQLTEVMTQIADYERRINPEKKNTVLGNLLGSMPKKGETIKDKRPSRNGGGHRQTSFASRVTIKDVEGDK